jgi:hypothetical protein
MALASRELFGRCAAQRVRTPVIPRPENHDHWLQGSPDEAIQLVHTCNDELRVDRTPNLWSKPRKARPLPTTVYLDQKREKSDDYPSISHGDGNVAHGIR